MDRLRELILLLAIGSALTVTVFFLALWLLPFETFTPLQRRTRSTPTSTSRAPPLFRARPRAAWAAMECVRCSASLVRGRHPPYTRRSALEKSVSRYD